MLTPCAINDLIGRHVTGRSFVVALSGGVDSITLLHLMHAIQQTDSDVTLRAIHVNHGLQAQANQWQSHCEALCQTLDIPLYCEAVAVTVAPGLSVEAEAREARYRVFEAQLKVDEVLLLAQHADDQAETLLLQLLRGAGPQGLAAMPVLRSLGEGQLLRPLLTYSRVQIIDYAREHDLQWVEDDSNRNTAFQRNYLRHDVIPLLAVRYPGILKTLNRSARHCGEAVELLREYAESDFKAIKTGLPNTNSTQNDTNSTQTNAMENPANPSLPLESWLNYSDARQRNVLRYWIQSQGALPPSEKQLSQLQSQLQTWQPDHAVSVTWGNVEVNVFQNKAVLISNAASLENSDAEKFDPVHWDLQAALRLPHQLGELHASISMSGGLDLEKMPGHDSGAVSVCFRKGGERFHPVGRSGSHPLKKLFQEWKVPPWERDKVPLVYYNDELVAVVGYAIADAYYTSYQGCQLIRCTESIECSKLSDVAAV